MNNASDLELIPDEDRLLNRTFKNPSESERFWDRFFDNVSDELKRLAEARRGSEEDAKRRWLR